MAESLGRWDVNLPDDLAAFLRSGHQLEYDSAKCEPGLVTLHDIASLELIEIYIDSTETPFEPCDPPEEDDIYEYNPDEWDPHCAEGYYAIPVVPLISHSTHHSKRTFGTLLWYCQYNEYGQWDNEHSNAIRFGKVTWADIVRDPILFLAAKWRWDEEEAIFHWVTPWLDKEQDFRRGETPVRPKHLFRIDAT